MSSAKQDRGVDEQVDILTRKNDEAGTKKRSMHIKRFDPSNLNSHALLVKKETSDKRKMLDESRKEILRKKDTSTKVL
jgi:hypothetical protein